MDDKNIIMLDYHQLLFNYLRLLGFDCSLLSVKHRIKFDKDMFKLPNPRAFEHVVYFLLCELDKPKVVEQFKDVWPMLDKKQEAQFRKKVHQWLTQIQENKHVLFSHVNLSIFLSPGGDKFVKLMAALASYVLGKKLDKTGILYPPTLAGKSCQASQLSWQLLCGNLRDEFVKMNTLTHTYLQRYQEQKNLAGNMIRKYRELCKKKEEMVSRLHSTLQHSNLSKAQKHSLCDLSDQTTFIQLKSEMEKHKHCLDSHVKAILNFEKPFLNSWNIISSIIAQKKSNYALDGKSLLSCLPPGCIECYQNIHSGTHFEIQFKDGYLDLLPLFNLLLFSAKQSSNLNNNLLIPPLKDELDKLNRYKATVNSANGDAEKLYQRWNDLAEKQKVHVQSLLLHNLQEVSMTLQSITPFRSLLTNGNPAEEKQNLKTPASLRAALGMTPILMGAKPKLRLGKTLETRKSLGSKSSPVSFLLVHKSADGSPMFKSSPIQSPAIEMKSTEQEQSRSSFGRSIQSRIPSRKPKTRGNIPDPKKAHSPFPKKSTEKDSAPTNVLEQAAEAIVFDLVNLNSPITSQNIVVDPNSSFELNAFSSRNLIPRSPDCKVSNVELLQLLESSFASPRRSSLTLQASFNKNLTNSLSHLHTSTSYNDWNIDYEREKGLLEVSSASLIDDALDFSFM